MHFNMNRMGLAWVCAALLCGAATAVRAADYNLNFDPVHDYPAGALTSGVNLATVTSVYKPLYGIEIAEPSNGFDISKLGGGGDNGWLNVGFAPNNRLHWFVNAAPGYYFPAGSTISVDWSGSDGGPAALKAFAGTIDTNRNISTITNANDSNAFGGKVGSVVGAPDSAITLSLVLPANAKSFTVHQSVLGADTYVTGPNGILAPNAAINGIRLTVLPVPEPATAVSLAAVGLLVPFAARRRGA